MKKYYTRSGNIYEIKFIALINNKVSRHEKGIWIFNTRKEAIETITNKWR